MISRWGKKVLRVLFLFSFSFFIFFHPFSFFPPFLFFTIFPTFSSFSVSFFFPFPSQFLPFSFPFLSFSFLYSHFPPYWFPLQIWVSGIVINQPFLGEIIFLKISCNFNRHLISFIIWFIRKSPFLIRGEQVNIVQGSIEVFWQDEI